VPGFDRTIDAVAVATYFKYGYIPAPLTIWQSAKKLPAAAILSFTHADIAARRALPRVYWSAAGAARAALSEPLTLSQQEAESATEDLLTQSVTRRLASDVPLGALLSGGVDSSLVTALMQRASSQPVRTFSIGMDADGYDESGSARAVAQHLGTDHTELILSAADVQDAIPEIAGIYDEPFADSSQIPTFLVSRMSKRDVTVALTGDGGDEIFGGYNRYFHAPRLWRKLERIPAPLRSTLGHMLARAPSWAIAAVGPRFSSELAGGRAEEKVRKFARIMQAADRTAYLDQLLSTGGRGSKKAMCAAQPLHLTDRAHDTLGDFAMSAMLLDTTNYLPDDILVKVDRASMAVSLELRTPFLNREVFTHAWRLPPRMKTSSTQGKLILREILYKHVPRHLVDRPKSGFAIPLGKWLRGGLRDWADDLISPTKLEQSGWLDPQATRAVWQNHLSGNSDAAAYLWSVLMFQTWWQSWKQSHDR
jgi:asparagine synthase (glutamine-hydrolysing)